MQTKKEKKLNFGSMNIAEIEMFEKNTNSLVLFSNERGVCFQKSSDEALSIQIDGCKKPLYLFIEQIKSLKCYLTKNFKR